MKILIAAEIFPPDIGGPATYSLTLASLLAEKKENDVRVICYGQDANFGSPIFKIIRISRKQNKLKRYFNYFFELKKMARDVDVIYAQGPMASGLPAILANKILKKKVIVKVVGDYAWEQAVNSGATDLLIDDFQKKKFFGRIGLLQTIERYVCRWASQVIVPSEYLKKIVSGWGVAPEKVKVIYNAPPLNIKLLSNRQDNLIVSVGRLVPWKGFPALIEIMPDLLKINPNFLLRIYGDGPERNNLVNLIKSKGLEKSVSISKVGHEEIMFKIAEAEIFILNTGYEGLSHTILEAMAAGTPVITTKAGGNPEIVQDYYNGLLFDYNDKEQFKSAILKLWQNKELQKKLTDNARESLNKFDFNKIIDSTITILNY